MVDISIIIPSYNNIYDVADCLNSFANQTLSQDKYEIIICDDGSDAITYEKLNDCIDEFRRENDNISIKIISKQHTGLADTYNFAIEYTSGEFICIFKPNDCIENNKLEKQYNFLNTNKDTDIVLHGYLKNDNDELIIFDNFDKTIDLDYLLDRLLEDNFSVNYSFMFRKKSVCDRLPFLFEQYFDPICEYKFLCLCCQRGLVIKNMQDVLMTYSDNIDNYERYCIMKNRIYNLYKNHTFDNERNITAILTFNNENTEVERTIQSIFATSKHTQILLIDDASTDNYNYQDLLKYYSNVRYINNGERQGVAESRNIGVRNSTTEHCILFDAHMRLYDDDWDERIDYLLNNYKNCIMCSQSVTIRKTLDNIYTNEDDQLNKHLVTYGSTIELDYTIPRCFRHKWNYNKLDLIGDGLIEIPVVLGAFYCFDKTHWEKIHGLNGLIKYGLDEALMSVKTWLFGGKCYLISDLYVGHLYRDKMPYTVKQSDVAFNEYLLINYFIEDKDLNKYINNLHNRISEESKKELKEDIELYSDVIKREKEYIKENSIIPFEWFNDYNTHIVNPKKKTKYFNNTFLTIIIYIHNNENIIKTCVNSILELSLLDKIHIVFIDDNSNDFSKQIIEGIQYNNSLVDIDIITNQSNIGYEKSINDAKTHVIGKYYCILNLNEIYVDYSWLENLYNIIGDKTYDYIYNDIENDYIYLSNKFTNDILSNENYIKEHNDELTNIYVALGQYKQKMK